MKKLTVSVATLCLALSMNAQDTVDYWRVTNPDDKVAITKFEILEMINTIDDILEWQEYDRENGETGMGKHSEGWGSNYWLTIMKDDLYAKLENKVCCIVDGQVCEYEKWLDCEQYINCENCDEID